MVLSLRPGGTTLWLRGIGPPGIYRVDVPIQNEVQNQYETHQRLPLKVATRLREQPIIGPGWIEGASREGSRTLLGTLVSHGTRSICNTSVSTTRV